MAPLSASIVRWLLPLAIALAAIGGSAAALGIIAVNPRQELAAGIYILGVHVGGMSSEEALALLQPRAERLERDAVHITVGDESFEVVPRQAGLHVDLPGMIEQAAAIGREGSLLRRVQEVIAVRRGVFEVPVRWKTDREKMDAWLDRVVTEWSRLPENAAFVGAIGGRAEILPSRMGQVVLRFDLEQRLREVAARMTLRTFELPVHSIPPDVYEADILAMGLVGTIGSFTTRFDPADVNRVHNIVLAASAIDGVLLAPGETFSFNDVVGPRGPAQGYKPAPVIVAGDLVVDYGGGVCQVSTTLYNAVLRAGLQVTTRAPHSIPPSYVPLGMDAAVADGWLDFRFTNNTDHYVYIAAGIEGDQLHVELFGTGAPLPVRFVTELLEVIPPQVVEVVDASLAPGERVVDQAGRQGYRVRVMAVPLEGDQPPVVVSHSHYPVRHQVVRVPPVSG